MDYDWRYSLAVVFLKGAIFLSRKVAHLKNSSDSLAPVRPGYSTSWRFLFVRGTEKQRGEFRGAGRSQQPIVAGRVGGLYQGADSGGLRKTRLQGGQAFAGVGEQLGICA